MRGKVTLDLYMHGDEDTKRTALTHASGLFAITAKAS
jgi:hypothetical protein